jgi:hypothetical protein
MKCNTLLVDLRSPRAPATLGVIIAVVGREKYWETHAISHKNWEYPKGGPSPYILPPNFIDNTHRGRQVCFQTIIHCPSHQRDYKGAHDCSFDTLRQMTMTYISQSQRLRTYNNNNNNNNKLQLGWYPVAVVISHVYKIWHWLLLNLSREGYMRSM